MMLVNDRGIVVRLGNQLTTPGGEGAIYDVASDPTLVAKLYHSTPDSEKTAKLQFLCRSASAGLTTAAAWPKSLLYATNDHSAVRGFLMPRVTGKEIHRLYGPRDRHLEFPSAAWDFLIHVAKNCAVAFETLHANGVVMADVNEKNLLVTNEGLVRLIDCDSYQVCNGSHRFLCDVGVPLWTPPELQLQIRTHGYNGLERTPSHDRFGLAILVFQLLFMGRHPFAGVPDGQHFYEIHESIERFLFAFSSHGWKRGVKVPPHTLPLSALPEKLIRLFERAFLPGSERPDARPTGQEWALALEYLYLARKTCTYDPSHKFWNGLTTCPWCEITSGGGPNFFIAVAVHLGSSGTISDAAAFWTLIDRITSSGLISKTISSTFPLPNVTAKPLPISRSCPPRISKPQPPPQPVLLPFEAPPPPFRPLPPTMPRPAKVPRLALSHGERAARISLIGFALCACLCCGFASFGLIMATVLTGTAATAFLALLWQRSDCAASDRKHRLLAERKARADALMEAKAEHERQLTKHAATVAQIESGYARLLSEAQAAQARHQLRIDAEYHSRLSAYLAQLRLFEAATVQFEEEKRQWDSVVNARAQSVEQTRREMNDTWERLSTTLTSYQSKVRPLRTTFQAAYDRFKKACEEEATAMRLLETGKRDAQLRQYLDSQLIRNHSIPSIRRNDKATLLANGIESALDITSTMKKLPGIGDTRRHSLLAWRVRCEFAFRYNAAAPLPQAEVHAVRMKYAQAKQLALVELRGGAGTLSTLEVETQKAVAKLETKLPELIRLHAQAVADHALCI
jgi:DNA-binding helix-hairpin-helix protein with protein kinase domain